MPEPGAGTERWPPSQPAAEKLAMPGWGLALVRGVVMRCPACGRAGVFGGFIAVRPVCPSCAAPLGRVRLELLPSFLTILLGLWVMGAVMFFAARLWHPGLLPFIAVFVPLCILFELALARPMRGLMLAVMMKMNVFREGPGSATGGAPQDPLGP